MNILDSIQSHGDLVALSASEREHLCSQIREFLVSHVAKTGGHLASNLGVVELAVAIETVYDTARDRLVFDVGHQSYVHKLLTGRQKDFDRLRQFGGMAGFPKPGESVTDSFVAGHASSSVSIALGMARARSMMGEDYSVVALIGDGATTGGMAYEGLNDAGFSNEPMVVILNDNEMSISKNVGGVSKHLSRLRVRRSYRGAKKLYLRLVNHIPGGQCIYRFTHRMKEAVKRSLLSNTIFEDMGFTYLGPVDGHDLPELINYLQVAKSMNRPVLLHVVTQKGRGYLPAEENPARFHGIGKFDPVTGDSLSTKAETFSDAFGKTMLELAAKDQRICAITAAMPGGTGLLDYRKAYPQRLFDVGIAEEHAVSMAGGLAKQGMIPVTALYSTFLQRSYDMILQDVAMLHLHVILAVDRAGLVGEDGETHHGVFDVGFLRQAPGMRVLCPASTKELHDMLTWAALSYDGPVAIRYPRGGNGAYTGSAWDGKKSYEILRKGKDLTLVSYGTAINLAMKAAELLSTRGIDAGVIRLLDLSDLTVLPETAAHVAVIEEVCSGSGIKEELAWHLRQRNPSVQVTGFDLGKRFVPHGDNPSLLRLCGLDPAQIAEKLQEVIRREK